MTGWLIWWVLSLLGARPGGPECVALVGLDAQRAEALAAGDREALGALHVSPDDGAVDLAVLDGYAARGLTVHGAMLIVLECAVSARDGDLVWLEVTDRLAPTVVVDAAGERRALPTDEPTRRTVVLQQVDGTWRYAGS